MTKLISFCEEVANASTQFEQNTSKLKLEYLKHNIMLYNYLTSKIVFGKGTFGTGYPFTSMDENLTGELPIIEEQIRYNNELAEFAKMSQHNIWHCADCMSKKGNLMPDLKQICKPCPNMENELKPRKIINRLPDIDMWFVCDKDKVQSAQDTMTWLMQKYNIKSSDVNPLKSIEDELEIIHELQNGIMPNKNLPIDTHIMDYETLYTLIESVPEELKSAYKSNQAPYLPIHPISFRKTWQYDDVAYNFIYDYLSSFTPFNFDSEMKQLLDKTRSEVANTYTAEELYAMLIASATDANKRRYENVQLKRVFRRKVESWKR